MTYCARDSCKPRKWACNIIFHPLATCPAFSNALIRAFKQVPSTKYCAQSSVASLLHNPLQVAIYFAHIRMPPSMQNTISLDCVPWPSRCKLHRWYLCQNQTRWPWTMAQFELCGLTRYDLTEFHALSAANRERSTVQVDHQTAWT